MKKKVSLMIVVIMLLQIILPIATVIWESEITLVSRAEGTEEATVDGITWTYTMENGNAINVGPKDKNTLPTEVIIPDELNGNTVTSIKGRAFSECSSLESVIIPNGVTSIEDSAFYSCSSLTSITIPDTVTKLGMNVFEGCSSLKIVKIPSGITRISGYMFKGCSSLKSVAIPNTVTKFGWSAFEGCSSLKSVKIPNSVTSIENDAFLGCSSLTSINIPSEVNRIYYNAFDGCSSLTSIEVSDKNAIYSSKEGVLFNKDGTELIRCPEGKVEPNYEIPSSVTEIWEYAFENCNNIESINISESFIILDEKIFNNCNSLKSITVAEKNAIYSSKEGVLFNKAGTELIRYPEGKTDLEYTIPSSVKTVRPYAFLGCSSLERVTIPSSVGRITDSFEDCSSLESIDVEDDNYNYFDIDGVLFDKMAIRLKRYPAGKAGTEYTIPSNATCIDNSAFSGCRSLESVVIPTGVTEIRDYAFEDCSSLASIEIPSSVKRIGTRAFRGCSGLTTITIPASVKTLEDDIFNGCNNQLKIYCRSDSEAETYAKNNGLYYITDDRAPVIETVSVSPNSGYVKSKTITIVARDSGGSGLATNAYSFDGGATWQSSPTAEFTKNGAVDIWVKDKLGNLSAFIEVKLSEIIELESISVKSKPTKLTYKKGENLNTSGLKLTAKYKDGSTETIETGFTCTPTKLDTKGTQTITVTYGGKTTTFNITVERELTGINIKTNPTKLTYKKGENLNTSGLTLTATYNDGTTETIETGFECTPTKLDKEGIQTITVAYGGKTATFNVTVKKELESIKVITPPTKTSYVVGQSFDKTGMVVQATYNDGTTANITGYTITNGSSLTNGQSSVTISYTEGEITAKTTQTITVEGKKISRIERLNIDAFVLEVVQGDTLNREVDIRVIYNDGDEEIVSGVTVEPKVFNQLGTQAITATYAGHTIKLVEVEVVPKELTSIKVTKLPTNTQYIEGQDFDSSGMEVEATYNNEKTANITGYKIAYGSNLTKGQTEVEISYEEDGITQKTTQTITVHAKKPTEIKVSKKPTKTKYAAGENFDATGMEVIAYYDNGTSEKITDYAISNGTNLQQGNIDIEISYTKEGTTQKTTTPIRVLRTETDSNGITWWYELVQGNAVNVHYKSGTLGAEVTIPAKLGGRDVIHLYNDGYKNIFATSLYQQNGTIEKINLPESIIVIDKFAFAGCRVLKEINIPQNVIRIDHSAFINCTSLKNIEIPEGVTSIGYTAFYGCSSLTSIIIPSSVEMISNYAFQNCSSLESIVIPSNVQTISNGAFLNDDKLIIYCETSSEAQSYAMKNNHSYIAISSQFEVEEVEGIKYIKNIAPIPVGNVIGMIETDGEVKAYKGSQEITNLQGTTIETGMTIKVRTNNKEIEYRTVVGRRRTNNISLRIRNK